MRAKKKGQSALLLLDVIDVLNKERVPYAVIGAVAVAFYGPVRASLDADALISVARDTQTLERLKEKLAACGLKVIIKTGGGDDPLLGVMLVEDAYANQVDLILGIKGMDEGAFERTRKGSLHGHDLDIIALEDLIAMKVYAGSARDIEDVKGVLAVSGGSLDKKLLRQLTARYGTRELKVLEGLLKA